jgi:hypothetical protein
LLGQIASGLIVPHLAPIGFLFFIPASASPVRSFALWLTPHKRACGHPRASAIGDFQPARGFEANFEVVSIKRLIVVFVV